MGDLLQDLRFGLRGLLRAPGFTAACVLTLALGIGANTAVFSVVDALLLRPLPFAAPGELVSVWGNSPAELVRVRELTGRSFTSVAGYAAASYGLADDGGGGEPERVDGARVSPAL